MFNLKFNIFQCHYRIKSINILVYQRHTITFMLMCAIMNLYGMRFAVDDTLAYLQPKNKKSPDTKMVMDWSPSQILMLRRCFGIGYVIGHLPSGCLCDLYGGRSYLIIGIVFSTLITFATPSIIIYCPWWVMLIRNAFLGLAEGMSIPAFSSLMSHWIPNRKLTAGSAIGYSGGTLGNLLGEIFASRFTENLDSWTWVFYTWGIISSIWIVIACCYIFSNPESHPFVSERERELLEEEMGSVLPNKVPLISILTDSGMWALLMGQVGHDWTLIISITSMRRYIQETLEVDDSQNLVALYCSHLLYWANTCFCGILANYIIRKEYWPRHNVRTLFAAIGIIAPGITALILTYCDDTPNLVVTLSILTLFLKGPINAGLEANIFDITRHYAGTIAGLINGLGAVTSVVTYDLINNMAPENTVRQWNKIAWMSFAICCYSYLVFFIWIKSTTAHWEFEKKIKITDAPRTRKRLSFSIK